MDGRTNVAAAGRRLSLVIPAYNEEAGVRQAVVEADEALARLVDDYEILVVDDGSRDATAAIVTEEAAARPHVRLLRHETNCGYGAALRTGFEAARFDLVAFTDADCQFYLADLDRLLPLTDRVPIAAGWREARQDSWLRCFVSRGYNLLTRTLLGTCVRDCDCALKVFHREALAAILPETKGFFVNTEMLTRARQLGLEVVEAGVRHRPRLRGKSTVSPRDVPRTLAALLPFWWSAVMFPGGQSPSTSGYGMKGRHAFAALSGRGANTTPPKGRESMPPPRLSPLLAMGVLTVLAGLLFFTQLRAPLLEPQESRYAEIPRQMLAEGRLITPVLHGLPYLDKPPLLYWSVMSAYFAFGAHDWAARLVPAFAGLLTVLLTYIWGRRVAGDGAGLVGALVLCLSARFVYLERMLTMDCLLCLWTTAGLAAAHIALAGGRCATAVSVVFGRNPHTADTAVAHAEGRLRWGWWLLSAAACGLGVLTKGPVALVLVVVPMAAYCWLDARAARAMLHHWAAYLAVVALIAGPWYAAIIADEPEFAFSFFWTHNVVRFVAPFDHAEPWWFHLPALVLGMLPWTLALPGFVRFLFRRSAPATARRPAALGFFLLAGCLSLLFFSASGCKRSVYILPTLPPLALALGCYLSTLWRGGILSRSGEDVVVDPMPRWAAKAWRTPRLAQYASLLVLAMGAGAALVAAAWHLVKPGTAYGLASAAVAAMALVVAMRRRVSWPACAAATFAVLFAAVLVLPAYNRQYSLRDCLRDVPRTRGLPVVCYPQMWDSVTFYLPQADVRAYGVDERAELLRDLRARPGTLLLVKSGPVLKDLLRDLPESVDFLPRHGGRGGVTAGWVRARTGPADDLMAER
jgi:dolichol-phosphate mannosyltransferase